MTAMHRKKLNCSMYRILPAIFLLMALTVVISGCVPDELTDYDFKQFQPPSTLPVDKGNVLIGEQEASGVKVMLYIDKGAHTGYNRLGIMLMEASSETLLEEALISLESNFEHGGNTWDVLEESPSTNSANTDGFFEGSAFFLPPEPDAGAFSLKIAFDAGNGREGEVLFPLSVEESLWMQRVDTPTGRYYASWVNPARPEVGQNLFEIALHQEADGHYLPIDNATIDLYPYMDMGGGDGHSSPYVAPKHTGNGRYQGTVDFIMSGGWELSVYVTQASALPDTVRFLNYTVY